MEQKSGVSLCLIWRESFYKEKRQSYSALLSIAQYHCINSCKARAELIIQKARRGSPVGKGQSIPFGGWRSDVRPPTNNVEYVEWQIELNCSHLHRKKYHYSYVQWHVVSSKWYNPNYHKRI